MKKPTVSIMHKKVWKVFSRYIRMRDAIRTTGEPYSLNCITCTRNVNIKESDAGHFMSRARKSTLYDEKNVAGQCKACNGWGSGEQYRYGLEIDQLYGSGTAEQIELESQQLKQYKVPELEELLDFYKSKLRDLEEIYGEMW